VWPGLLYFEEGTLPKHEPFLEGVAPRSKRVAEKAGNSDDNNCAPYHCLHSTFDIDVVIVPTLNSAKAQEEIFAMGLTIWKETLAITGSQTVMLPAGAKILCAKEQHGEICIWFQCDPSAPKKPRRITVAGTGHPCHDGGRHIGSVVYGDDGTFVFHVFEWPD